MTAKINNTNISIKSIVPRVSKKLSVQRPPGSNSDAIEGLGSQGAELQIELQSDTLAEKHIVTAEFLKSGPQTLEDPDGFIYSIVESQATGGRNYESEPNLDQRWLFGFQCLMEEPYKFSSTEKTRIKTISTNNQEWSTDDFAVAITTAGTIDVIPDIEVVAGALGPDFEREGEQIEQYTASGSDAYNHTEVFSAVPGISWRLDPGRFDYLALTDSTTITVYAQATSYNGGVEKAIYTQSITGGSGSYGTINYTPSETVLAGENEDLNIRYYATSGTNVGINDFYTICTKMQQAVTKDLIIYNTADTTRKVQVCNEINPGTTVNINKNGTGHYNYPDDFSTDTYKYVSYDYNNVTYDDPNDRITVVGTSGGYLIYKIDCKYPITGIPTLTVNLWGIIKIAIAENVDGVPGTFYEIRDLITDVSINEDVFYYLDSPDISLKGLTSFFVKVYPSAPADYAINSFEFDADLVTIDALLPYVYLGSSNTFRADQNSDSGLNATVELSYRDGHWVI